MRRRKITELDAEDKNRSGDHGEKGKQVKEEVPQGRWLEWSSQIIVSGGGCLWRRMT